MTLQTVFICVACGYGVYDRTKLIEHENKMFCPKCAVGVVPGYTGEWNPFKKAMIIEDDIMKALDLIERHARQQRRVVMRMEREIEVQNKEVREIIGALLDFVIPTELRVIDAAEAFLAKIGKLEELREENNNA